MVPKCQSANEDGALNDALTLKIFEAIKNNPAIIQKEMVKELGIPRRTLQRKMMELQNNGNIERVGGKRFGHWKIIEN